MLDRCYNWMIREAQSKNAVWVLMLVSFVESSFFPFPPDPVLSIVVSKNKHRFVFFALMCAAASVLGGFLGYFIGHAFFDLIGSKILAFYGQVDSFHEALPSLNKWAFWLICLKGLTPIPYKVVTIASGFAHVDLLTFATASIITRTSRFLLLSYLSKRYGEQILNFIEKNKKLTLVIIIGSVVVGFLLLKFFI